MPVPCRWASRPLPQPIAVGMLPIFPQKLLGFCHVASAQRASQILTPTSLPCSLPTRMSLVTSDLLLARPARCPGHPTRMALIQPASPTSNSGVCVYAQVRMSTRKCHPQLAPPASRNPTRALTCDMQYPSPHGPRMQHVAFGRMSLVTRKSDTPFGPRQCFLRVRLPNSQKDPTTCEVTQTRRFGRITTCDHLASGRRARTPSTSSRPSTSSTSSTPGAHSGRRTLRAQPARPIERAGHIGSRAWAC
jgi:hypothetical protein